MGLTDKYNINCRNAGMREVEDLCIKGFPKIKQEEIVEYIQPSVMRHPAPYMPVGWNCTNSRSCNAYITQA
jgi:hypothetical protein